MIRAARVDDVARLQEIEWAAGAAFRDVGMAAIADDGPAPRSSLTAAVEHGGARVVPGPDDVALAYLLDAVVDGEGHVEQVSVHPSHARRGLGRLLVDDAGARAAAAGRPTLTLTTFVDVPWNGPYYARLGFRALTDDEIGPELRAIRDAEIARGLDRWPRCAMRRRHPA